MKSWMRCVIWASLFSVLVACGGGGGGDGGSDSGVGGGGNDGGGNEQSHLISGTAAKGLIYDGSVRIFSVNAAGHKADLLDWVSTDSRGRFFANVDNYNGTILVEASGKYLDEATGVVETIAENSPLRAAMVNVNGDRSLAVTPFTELAVRRAVTAGGLSAVRIQEANTLLSKLFHFDVLVTEPVAPTVQEFAGAGTAQKNSTLALAALCQMAAELGGGIPQLQDALATEISGAGKLSIATLERLDKATNDFLSSSRNETGIFDQNTTTLPQIGYTPVRLRFQTQGVSAPSAIGGIELLITLPEGARLPVDTSGQLLNGVVTLASGINALLTTHYLPESGQARAQIALALISTEGFGGGNFAWMDFEVLGPALPSLDTFTLDDFTVVDGNGAPIGASAFLIVEARP